MTHRVLFRFLALFLCALPLLAAPAKHDLPEIVTILGQTLHLKEYQRDDQGQLLAEYIPEDQNWENWHLMFAIRIEKGKGLNPLTAARRAIANVEARKAFDLMANHAIFQKEDGTVVVDFMVSDQSEKSQRKGAYEVDASFYEHNLWRYFKVRDGLASYQIARRIYLVNSEEKQVKDFIKNVAKLRQRFFDEITSPKLPLPDHAR